VARKAFHKSFHKTFHDLVVARESSAEDRRLARHVDLLSPASFSSFAFASRARLTILSIGFQADVFCLSRRDEIRWKS